ncbi:MAG: DUF4288 domain-containing protein [Scytolyngbya sp. HA4215-MV1]|nr:DUF4288 domain-containing protein [Scytolyngbya sp. HA4215-MV1]
MLEVTVEGDSRIVAQIETYLVCADSYDQAYSRVVELGASLDYRYRNSDGKVVTMIYRGISELDAIQDVPKHGTQLAVRQLLIDHASDISTLIRSEDPLKLFKHQTLRWQGPNLSQ